jgi:hypothetical protein
MDPRTRRADLSLLLTVLLLVMALALVVAYAGGPVVMKGEAAPAPPQELTRIESRLSQLEQRFYSVEVSIRGLEQQSRLASVTPGRAERDAEVSMLRTEVETMRRRLAEVECGLTRVDERTLSAAAREARRRTEAVASDPCRLNSSAPLRLSARP